MESTKKTTQTSSEVQPVGRIKDVSDIVGPFGPWQFIVFLTVIYIEIIAAIYNYASPLLAAPVKIKCDLNETLRGLNESDHTLYGNLTLKDLVESKDHCQYTISSMQPYDERKCTNFDYTSTYTRSATQEWDLVCERNWMVSFTSSMTLLGDLIASLVLGHLADRIGRRKTMWFTLAITIAAPLITIFSKSYTQFVIGRFLCGASGYGFMIISYVMLMEIIGINYRALIGIMVKIGYTIGGIYVGLMAYWLKDWFKIQIASTIPVIFLIILCYIIPESPRWLILDKQQEAAEKVLEKGCKWNKRSTAELSAKAELLRQKIFQEVEKNDNHFTVWDLLKTPNTRWKTLILVLCWGISIFVYYGISLNSSTFSTDPIISFISICAIETPAHVLCILGTHYLGCKYSLIISLVFTSLMCFIGAGTEIIAGWQGILLVSLMKMGVTGAADIAYNISAEIFPTVVRAIGMGICSTFGRATAMASPFMKEVATNTSVSVPFSIFGALSLFSAFTIFFLPNTKDQLLPETMEECEKVPLEIPCKRKNEETTPVNLKLYSRTGNPQSTFNN